MGLALLLVAGPMVISGACGADVEPTEDEAAVKRLRFSRTLQRETFGRPTKLVATNIAEGRTLYFLDTASKTKRKLSTETNVMEPTISLDGTRVAYTQNRVVYVRSLSGGERKKVAEGYTPRWWMMPSSGEEWIYYTTVPDDPADVWRRVYWPHDGKNIKTRRVRLRDGKDELVLDWKGSGGQSKDGTHIVGDYATLILFDALSEAHVLNGGEQGCNGSMSPDNNYWVLFTKMPHKGLFVHDKADDELWHLGAPAGTSRLEDPEWSNHLDYASFAAREAGGNHSIWIAKLSEGENGLRRVLDGRTSGDDWDDPHLWVK